MAYDNIYNIKYEMFFITKISNSTRNKSDKMKVIAQKDEQFRERQSEGKNHYSHMKIKHVGY